MPITDSLTSNVRLSSVIEVDSQSNVGIWTDTVVHTMQRGHDKSSATVQFYKELDDAHCDVPSRSGCLSLAE